MERALEGTILGMSLGDKILNQEVRRTEVIHVIERELQILNGNRLGI